MSFCRQLHQQVMRFGYSLPWHTVRLLKFKADHYLKYSADKPS
ncbi:hypothetical protein yinte0001_37150 [Yersinia intermedia ATCC 29909]|nr:hypothetical protein yinte0001_37150 [Yersinia intermedia ATCC 29909]